MFVRNLWKIYTIFTYTIILLLLAIRQNMGRHAQDSVIKQNWFGHHSQHFHLGVGCGICSSSLWYQILGATAISSTAKFYL